RLRGRLRDGLLLPLLLAGEVADRRARRRSPAGGEVEAALGLVVAGLLLLSQLLRLLLLLLRGEGDRLGLTALAPDDDKRDEKNGDDGKDDAADDEDGRVRHGPMMAGPPAPAQHEAPALHRGSPPATERGA